ncbi:GntR family transcriptional regulator [Albidovulum inexpectatum]|uniref:GntR family transcriptional regulator n=1 Tax=Albidovulum inexpectatum TaxID=196587 RepID=A0A2S5JH39_9RHOB|nr:GntR family transcriptional regulator [Albidovulum inexpectatum]PPB80824.1 GntR family transcriptional regulator [Albidovulum inexpectatum]
MTPLAKLNARRTSVDDVFDYLYDEIISLRLKPGDKISEAEIAAQFGISRQPVRDAFNRLANLNLLLIRPQRATEVKRFSMREIVKARFVRAAIEKEVLRLAAERCTAQDGKSLDAHLKRQERALEARDTDAFGILDYEFHETLCRIGRVDFAFDVIRAEKSKVDRLCVLSLSKEHRMPDLVADHRAIAAAIQANDPDRAVEHGMIHLSRLDETIAHISANHTEFFEPE